LKRKNKPLRRSPEWSSGAPNWGVKARSTPSLPTSSVNNNPIRSDPKYLVDTVHLTWAILVLGWVAVSIPFSSFLFLGGTFQRKVRLGIRGSITVSPPDYSIWARPLVSNDHSNFGPLEKTQRILFVSCHVIKVGAAVCVRLPHDMHHYYSLFSLHHVVHCGWFSPRWVYDD
ncbi:hypothetical protein U1Q18_029555, partial [Sarracenia purpurea var. burkii]